MKSSEVERWVSSAEKCRRNGWKVGTRIVGDEGYGPTVIEITAIGEEAVLAKCISHNGEPGSWELVMVSRDNQNGEYSTIGDYHALEVFIWLGRYLAKKGKLPRHLALDATAVKAQRVSKDIRAIIATEHFQLNAEDEP